MRSIIGGLTLVLSACSHIPQYAIPQSSCELAEDVTAYVRRNGTTQTAKDFAYKSFVGHNNFNGAIDNNIRFVTQTNLDGTSSLYLVMPRQDGTTEETEVGTFPWECKEDQARAARTSLEEFAKQYFF